MLIMLVLVAPAALLLMASSAAATPIMGYALAPRYADSHNYKVVCYYGSWAVYRPGDGKYPVENIDPHLCTHLVYGFAGLGSDHKIRSLDSWNDLEDNYGKGAFKRFTALKKQNPKLKTLIAIGGWNEGSVKYSAMAMAQSSRKIFVDSVVDFCKKYGFDGLDMDWEYPGSRGGVDADKANFVELLKELSQEFKPYGLLLTAAVAAGKHFMDKAYDVPQVSRYLDLIHVMAYDFHGGWEKKTGHHAPLYSRPEEPADEYILNLNFSVNYWISQGAAREKMVLGMGLYGRAFTLQRAEDHYPGAPAPQPGTAGPFTREPGSLGYNEICEAFKRQSWTVVKDPFYMAPYAYYDRQWVGYDDMESIAAKVEFAKALGLAGGMVWSIETDDFQGTCHGIKYPMLSTINQAFALGGSGVIATPPPLPPTVPTTAAPVTEKTWWPQPSTKDPVTPSEAPTTQKVWWPQPTTIRDTVPPSRETPTTQRVWWPTVTPKDEGTSPFTPSGWTPQSTPEITTSVWVPSTDPGTGTTASSEFKCSQSGTFRHPTNCQKFFDCVHQNEGVMAFEKSCAPGTVFNPANNLCVWPDDVPDCKDHYLTQEKTRFLTFY